MIYSAIKEAPRCYSTGGSYSANPPNDSNRSQMASTDPRRLSIQADDQIIVLNYTMQPEEKAFGGTLIVDEHVLYNDIIFRVFRRFPDRHVLAEEVGYYVSNQRSH
jgi:hypothetical protein